jgi:hypothetical protein
LNSAWATLLQLLHRIPIHQWNCWCCWLHYHFANSNLLLLGTVSTTADIAESNDLYYCLWNGFGYWNNQW